MRLSGTAIGIGATAVAVVFALTYPAWAPLCPRGYCVTVNEYGDWLAGFAQPIALAWLIAGFWLQRTELQLQRTELTETRAELQRQASAAEGSERSSLRTVFVTLFPQIDELLERPRRRLTARLKEALPNTSFGDRTADAAALLSRIFTRQPDDTNRAAARYLGSPEFKELRDAYVGTMNSLFDLARRCDEPKSSVFVDLVRSSPHFGLYRVIQHLLPAGDLHEAALGDRLLDERPPIPTASLEDFRP